MIPEDRRQCGNVSYRFRAKSGICKAGGRGVFAGRTDLKQIETGVRRHTGRRSRGPLCRRDHFPCL